MFEQKRKFKWNTTTLWFEKKHWELDGCLYRKLIENISSILKSTHQRLSIVSEYLFLSNVQRGGGKIRIS